MGDKPSIVKLYIISPLLLVVLLASKVDSKEICDGTDNDGDGLVDEGFGIGLTCKAMGECGFGVIECADPYSTRCSTAPGGSRDRSSPELCDGRDNDCDGRIDEDFSVGKRCKAKGDCGYGKIECKDNHSTICSTAPGGSQDSSSREICDGKDNDCDGIVDEDFDIGKPCKSKGVCGSGKIECAGEMRVRCSSSPGGSEDRSSKEICDGKDNDCDGDVDEDFGVGRICRAKGVCGEGRLECKTENSVICSTGPGGSQDKSIRELCDDLDNDCDGMIDEDYGVGNACVAKGVCGKGVIECHGEKGTRCSTEPGGSQDRSSREICDGLDNDCDGKIDEDFHVGSKCNSPGQCGEGTLECKDFFTVICNTAPGGSRDRSSPEMCDGKDNDCDGLVDEDYSTGKPCRGKGQCGYGTFECADVLSARCSTEPGGSEDMSSDEVCDGIDNDCDGEVDEDVFRTDEVCDGADNDCDGLIDEFIDGCCTPDMVRVESFCIDKYEASVWSEPHCKGIRYGRGRDDYPSEFPDRGDFKIKLYACSIEGEVPSTHITWYQAFEACSSSGKRLCTISEWQKSCSGRLNLPYPYGKSYKEGICNGRSEGGRNPVPTGLMSLCRSAAGVFDQVGNVAEWTSTASPGDQKRAILGGSFRTDWLYLRCDFDRWEDPLRSDSTTGFRCCK
jgi:hypothetical protein